MLLRVPNGRVFVQKVEQFEERPGHDCKFHGMRILLASVGEGAFIESVWSHTSVSSQCDVGRNTSGEPKTR